MLRRRVRARSPAPALGALFTMDRSLPSPPPLVDGSPPPRPSPVEGEGVTGCPLARAGDRLRPAPWQSRPAGRAPRRARLGIQRADAADRLSAARDRLMCCRESRSFADLVGTELP